MTERLVETLMRLDPHGVQGKALAVAADCFVQLPAFQKDIPQPAVRLDMIRVAGQRLPIACLAILD